LEKIPDIVVHQPDMEIGGINVKVDIGIIILALRQWP
jgi:hypothetical protein